MRRTRSKAAKTTFSMLAIAAAAALLTLAGCGSSGGSASGTSSSTVLTTQSANSAFAHAQLTAGTFSVQLDTCAKPAAGSLVLAEATAQGGYDPQSGSTLTDGGSVTVSKSDSYAVVPFNSDIGALSTALAKLCYPWSVTLTPK